MPTDLWYFYESDLDKDTIGSFYESLPGHLQSKFKACNKTKIIWGNVLQGYRGPSNMCNGGSGDSETLGSSNGLQQVKFWWGARKDLNFIPVVGPIAFLTGRVVQTCQGQMDWRCLYFDSKTGECLSHEKNEACDELNRRGDQLFREGRFAEAAEYYENAYRSCSSGYRNEQSFQDNRRRANAEIEAIDLNAQGDRLFAQGEYGRAKEKYSEAYDRSNVETRYSQYRTNSNRAEAEVQAIELNAKGDHFFQQGEYAKAYGKYQEAYDKSKVNSQFTQYRANKSKAKSEMEADELNRQGNNLFEQGDYSGASEKYQQAYDKSNVHERYHIYSTNRSRAEAEVEAINQNSRGHLLFQRGDFTNALAEYRGAYDASTVDSQRRIYQTHQKKAQAEMDAENANSQGDALFERGKFKEAFEKYRDACNKSKVATKCQNYRANKDKAEAEMIAGNLKSCGDQLFKRGEYSEACSKYQQAFDTSAVNKTLYASAESRAKRETDAKKLNSQGNDLFKQGNYREAWEKYKEAYDTSQSARDKSAYLIRKNDAQAIVHKLTSIENAWNRAWEAENNDQDAEAAQLFQRVLAESTEAQGEFSGISKFRLFAALATLKIEGNESFNQGLESQQRGILLMQAAERLQSQQNYELAHENFEEARSNFATARIKFEEGSQSDERFVSLTALVSDLTDEVIGSINLANQQLRSTGLANLRLNLSAANASESDTSVYAYHREMDAHIAAN